MSEELMIRHCAPTLAGLKTASVFRCAYTSKEELCRQIRHLNCTLRRKGLRMIPLQFGENGALIYFYRPQKLQKDLMDAEAKRILAQFGYPLTESHQCVVKLVQRMQEGNGFPHEIGLFLGYPPEDVSGFIKHRAKDYKFSGLWKVYGNEAEAKRRFAQYKKCTDVYLSHLSRGKSIETLAVSQ